MSNELKKPYKMYLFLFVTNGFSINAYCLKTCPLAGGAVGEMRDA